MTARLPLMWIGIDPGAEHTGYVALDHNGAYVAHHIEQCDPTTELHDWCDQCVTTGWEFLTTRWGRDPDHPVDAVVAIEGIVAPSPHVNRRNGNAIIDPWPLLATAAVYGALTQLPATIVTEIAPGKNGSHIYSSYPKELVTDGERRRDGWQFATAGQSNAIRHARSAYDVARQAYGNEQLHNQGARHG